MSNDDKAKPLMKQAAERKKLIEHMLSAVEDDCYGRNKTIAFIESIREQFDARGTLSDKQLDALRNFYANV